MSLTLTKLELVSTSNGALQHAIGLLCGDTTFTNYWGAAEVALANGHKSSGHGRRGYRNWLLWHNGHGVLSLRRLFGLCGRL